MQRADVVALEEGLDEHLPVAALLAHDAPVRHVRREGERAELLVDRREVARHARRGGVERDPNEAVTLLDAGLGEAVRRDVQTRERRLVGHVP